MYEDYADPVEDFSQTHPSNVDVFAQLLHGYQCNTRSVSFCTFTAPWGISVPVSKVGRAVTLTYIAVVEGSCYFQDQTMSEALEIQAGDLFLFNNDCQHSLRDLPDTPTTSLMDMINEDNYHNARGLDYGGGGKRTRLMAGFFVFRQAESCRVLSMLPKQIHLKGKQGVMPGNLSDWVHRIHNELIQDRSGARSIADFMSRIVLVEILRHHEEQASDSVSWCQMLDDPDISAALRFMHKRSGENWTVQSLADAVGMSRSAFAARFHERIGQTPMAFLHELRMHRACAMLRDSDQGVKSIAASMGYASVASFSSAFKRWAGVSPGQYRKTGDIPKEHMDNLYIRSIMDY